MRKPITAAELRESQGLADLTDKVKEKIEAIVADHGGGPRADYLRGYLVGLCQDLGTDEGFLDELEGDAAAWSDGWSYCKAWVQTCDDTVFCPDEGDQFECYLVPKSQLET